MSFELAPPGSLTGHIDLQSAAKDLNPEIVIDYDQRIRDGFKITHYYPEGISDVEYGEYLSRISKKFFKEYVDFNGDEAIANESYLTTRRALSFVSNVVQDLISANGFEVGLFDHLLLLQESEEDDEILLLTANSYIDDRVNLDNLFSNYSDLISPNPCYVTPARLVVAYQFMKIDQFLQQEYIDYELEDLRKAIAHYEQSSPE